MESQATRAWIVGRLERIDKQSAETAMQLIAYPKLVAIVRAYANHKDARHDAVTLLRALGEKA
jgi:hypothetical protein